MAGVRHLRVIGLAVFIIGLVFVLHRAGTGAASLVHAQASDQAPNKNNLKSNNGPAYFDSDNKLIANNIVDSKNDDKMDAKINQEISKENDPNQDVAENKKESSSNSDNDGKEYDPAADLIKIRSLSPMTIFSKSYCPYSKKIKHLLLERYLITPVPNVVELDKHEFGAELQDYLHTKSGRSTVPNVLVGSSYESRGGFDDFNKYHEEGDLIKFLVEWGSGRLQVLKNDAPSNA
ncbi:Monothiol glutaredoxin-7 [Candida viswanathii]|uniref:Monothiol glutaredoxin-7 n=1 Tax=Candida viswanathii TaxID=5486 RepID=A0A367XWM4_9ASCO|nr:Monothiol glutaredoxin-7 [Candida viswanathii]